MRKLFIGLLFLTLKPYLAFAETVPNVLNKLDGYSYEHMYDNMYCDIRIDKISDSSLKFTYSTPSSGLPGCEGAIYTYNIDTSSICDTEQCCFILESDTSYELLIEIKSNSSFLGKLYQNANDSRSYMTSDMFQRKIK